LSSPKSAGCWLRFDGFGALGRDVLVGVFNRGNVFHQRAKIDFRFLRGLLLGLAVLFVFKQHRHVIQPHIRQIGLVLQNLAKIAHGLAMFGFHSCCCAVCVFIERGVMLGEALVNRQ